jgi:hypothetical protein
MVQTNTQSIRLWACTAHWTFSQIAVSNLHPSMSANAEARYPGREQCVVGCRVVIRLLILQPATFLEEILEGCGHGYRS